MDQPPFFGAPPYFQYSPPPASATASATAPAVHAPEFHFIIRSLFIKEYSWIIYDLGDFVKKAYTIPRIAAAYRPATRRKKAAGNPGGRWSGQRA